MVIGGNGRLVLLDGDFSPMCDSGGGGDESLCRLKGAAVVMGTLSGGDAPTYGAYRWQWFKVGAPHFEPVHVESIIMAAQQLMGDGPTQS